MILRSRNAVARLLRVVLLALVAGVTVVVGVVGVVGALAGTASADTGATPVGATSATTGAHRNGAVDLSDDDDDHAGAGSSARAAVPTWRGRTLTYRSTLPAKWSWSLTSAVAKWNASGAKIRLVPTTSAAKAQVTLGYGDTGGAAGLATVGRTRGAWVHLSPTYDTVDALDPWYRVEVMGVLAHELGHVLGFQHVTTPCSLMSPVMDVAGCGMFVPADPGWYRCQTIDPALAARFVKAYGGRARVAPTTPCLIDPMPSALQATYRLDATQSGADVTWAPPTFAPDGSQVEIRHWSAPSCVDVPADAATVNVDPQALSWRDEASGDSQDTCYQAVLANRYGVSRAASPVLLRPAVAAAMVATAAPDPTPAG